MDPQNTVICFFDKGAKTIYWEETKFFDKQGCKACMCTNSGPQPFTQYRKINLK